MVFTDLDGTLLDHKTYDWGPAKAALDRLRQVGAWVVLASSKTAAEVAPLRADIGFEHCPAIVENGGGVLPAGRAMDTRATEYARLRQALKDLSYSFQGFGDMTVAEVSELTGLDHASAARAKQRQFSEPGLWTGSDEEFARFKLLLDKAGLSLQRGGRFFNLSFGWTKADRVKEMTTYYAPRNTIALGDAPNDLEMLRSADFGVIVANPHGPKMPNQAREGMPTTKQPGPKGWSKAVLEILDGLSLEKETNTNG